nr:IS5-like element ISMich1 family transposase [Coleofasciculus chthonoplastes]
MYRKVENAPREAEDFELPFEGKLSQDNRWVIMASLVPWEEFEEEYAQNFSAEMGAPALPFRVALGSLIIKEKLGISDRETVEQIKENPYLQYFIGQRHYSSEAPYDSSLLARFRERINVNLVNRINEKMVKKSQSETDEEAKKSAEIQSQERRESANKGQLIVDASCVPGDISYPNDLGILNKARVKTEKIIDSLYEPLKDQLNKKPKTYRNRARKNYLKVAKKKRQTRKEIRKAIKKQLQYIKRNLGSIDALVKAGSSLGALSRTEYKSLLVVSEIYRQQEWMYNNKVHRIEHRIVNVSQAHIRPIVRGKAGVAVEFGAKISASVRDGYVFLDRISWDNFNESVDLKAQIEAYYNYTGFYPESVHVDKIYRSRANRSFCKEKGIRISGPPLGRPKANVSQELKKQAQEDERIRNNIEGKFGISKRRYSLSRVMAKLPHTSETAIAITFLVMNLSALLRQVFCLFYIYSTIKSFSASIHY